MQEDIEADKAMSKNKVSEMLFEQKLQNQMETLFHAFDNDGNGFVSSDEINLDNVTAQILEIFTPLFVEMENLGEKLNKEDFIESALNLFKTLGPIEKSAILTFKRDGLSLYEKYRIKTPHVPTIDPNSKEIVNQSELNGVAVVDRLELAELQKQERIYKLQKNQFEKDMSECSFAPKIDPNSNEIAKNAIQRQNIIN